MSGNTPWRLRYRLAKPLPTGQKVVSVSYASRETALHDGQRLFDAGCPVVTLTNNELPPTRRLVKRWQR